MIRAGIRANLVRLNRPQSATASAARGAANAAKSVQERAGKSLSAIQARAGPALNSVGNQVSGLASRYPRYTEPVIYWSKVVGELSKEVWKREKMSPPSLHQFQATFGELYAQATQLYRRAGKVNFQSLLQDLRQVGVQQWSSYGVVGLQILGFFAVGEIIGRRNLIGYSVAKEHHH